MIIAVIGSGGKTSLIKELTVQYRNEGKRVFVTTGTHMFTEEDTLLTDDADCIIQRLEESGYAMAGIQDGKKIKALPYDTYEAVCRHADVVLVEADGSRGMPLKVPDHKKEPVIPDNADEVIVVCGLYALGKKANEVCHRLELVSEVLGIDGETEITPVHIQKMLEKGYLEPVKEQYPEKKITIVPRHDGSLYQRVIASMLQSGRDVSVIREEWFCPQPRLIICGGGHVAAKTAAIATHLDFRIRVIDDREDFASKEQFPTAEEVICDSFENLEKYLEPDAYYVIVTPNHKADYHCVRTILPGKYAYLGMIGSKKKVAAAFEALREDGFSEEQIGTIFAPIGLSIGAVTPAEIAVSILSQIIQVKNREHAASADRKLLEVREAGMLCIITAKHGSTPRGVGSMMFVGKDSILGSIGGGAAEYRAVKDAREETGLTVRTYSMNDQEARDLGMVCGGTIEVLFIPV